MDSPWTGDGLVVDCLPGVHEALFPFPAPQETKSPCSEDDSSRDSGTAQSMYRVRKCWQVLQVAKDRSDGLRIQTLFCRRKLIPIALNDLFFMVNWNYMF